MPRSNPHVHFVHSTPADQHLQSLFRRDLTFSYVCPFCPLDRFSRIEYIDPTEALAHTKGDTMLPAFRHTYEMLNLLRADGPRTAQAISEAAPSTIGRSNADGGTDRTPAQRRALANEATILTGIPLLDSLSLIPDTAGSLLTAPAPISHAEAATILAGIWSEVLVDLPAILRKVNPATTRSGRRPRKVTELFASADYVATLPSARTNHGSAIHAAFQAQDADLRSFHGTARQNPLTPYQEARCAVAARRAQRALARLAANQGADW